MASPCEELYDIILDCIEARDDLMVSDIVYVLERIKHEYMKEIDRMNEEREDDKDGK